MKKEDFNIKISEFIRTQREKLNFSIRQLERKSGVSRMVICQLEGSIPFQDVNPRIHSLKNILTSLDQTFLDLFLYVYDKELKKD